MAVEIDFEEHIVTFKWPENVTGESCFPDKDCNLPIDYTSQFEVIPDHPWYSRPIIPAVRDKLELEAVQCVRFADTIHVAMFAIANEENT